MGAARYCKKTQADFERILESYFFWMLAPHWCYLHSWEWDEKKKKWELRRRPKEVKELIYLLLLPRGLVLLVYSSIDLHARTFRKCDGDRVRIFLVRADNFCPIHPIKMQRRFNRSQSDGNLLAKKFRFKVESILKEIGYFPRKKCKCGGIFILRKNRRDACYFFGCENYQRDGRTSHDSTISLRGKIVQKEDIGKSVISKGGK
ncbi:MAG TPA: hypothetical protein VFM02_02555 [Candidatus Paceibacterota bacterium]|nr:hypothetical protein [Candidatus Paceibacterota bacterium]